MYPYPRYRHERDQDRKTMIVALAICVIIGIGLLWCSQEIFSDEGNANITPIPTINPKEIPNFRKGDA